MNDLKDTERKNENQIKNSIQNAIEEKQELLGTMLPNTKWLDSNKNLTMQSTIAQFFQDNSWKNFIQKPIIQFDKQIITPFNSISSLGIDKGFNNVFSKLAGTMSNSSVIENMGISNSFINPIQHLIDILDMNSIAKSLNDALSPISKIFEQFNLSSTSKISGLDSLMLEKYYWVIPFEYEYDKLQKLSKYKTRINFEKYILRYFNDNRTKRMFTKIRKQCNSNDKKILIRQVENAFFNGDYAICITSLITMLDGLTLQLLEPNSDKQHLSYKAINDMLPYMNDRPPTEFSYELYLKVDILNNFYQKLYIKVEQFKKTNKRLLSRHINSHGVKYLNKEVETLRLLNVIYFCQQIIDETKLQERFTNKNNRFKVIS